MGKYSGIIERLPHLPPETTEFQARVEFEKAKIRELTTPELAAEYRDLRKKRDAIENQISELNIQIEARQQRVIELYEAEGISSIKLEDGSSVSTQPEPYAVVEDRDKFRHWCIANGYENALQLLWSTTNSIVKERLLKGEPEPDGVNAYMKTKVVWRKP